MFSSDLVFSKSQSLAVGVLSILLDLSISTEKGGTMKKHGENGTVTSPIANNIFGDVDQELVAEKIQTVCTVNESSCD